MSETFQTPTSSNVDSIEYDDVDQVLTVTYRNGGVYAYQGVPPFVFDALKATGSVGSFIARMVKDQFPFERVA